MPIQQLGLDGKACSQKTGAQVMDAMRTAVTNLLGTLPPSFFNVTVSAKQEDMAQIMYSACMTGYMYRNAQYRVDLDYDSLKPGADHCCY